MSTHVTRSTAFLVTLTFFGLSLVGSSGVTTAHAQEGISIKVQPSTIEVQVDPGQVLEGGALTITNENGGEQTYVISTRNVVGMDDKGKPDFSQEVSNDPLEASSWIQPLVETATINTGESAQIPYRIVVPENASPGSYFAAFFVTREADRATESGAGVGFNVASLVNLRVSGVVNEDMLFREFSTADKTFFSTPDVTFKVRLENTGTIHQRPRGVITILDMFGKEIGQTTFNDSNGAILPTYDRVFETTWNYDGFALGRYTAIASVLVGESKNTTLTREVTFWIIPLKQVGIVLGSVAALLLLFVFAVRRYVRNILRKAGHDTLSKSKSKKISLARRMIRTTGWLLTLLAVLFIGMIVFFA